VEETVNIEVQDQVQTGNDQQDEPIAVAEDNQESIVLSRMRRCFLLVMRSKFLKAFFDVHRRVPE
jgi:hypothetical protein